MDKLREWVLMHITIPIEAIILLRDDYREEIQKEQNSDLHLR
jgi:hypothetical protein